MNIKIKRSNEIPYEEMKFGEVFQYEGKTYMLTNQEEEDMAEEFKAVDLESGLMEIFGKNVMVHPYDNATIMLD